MRLKSLEIQGGIPLFGEICVQGSKNGVLPILAASLLGEGQVILEHCPDIRDVKDTLQIMKSLGCLIEKTGEIVEIDASNLKNHQIEQNTASRIRSSVLFLGALLGKMKKAVLPQPGGCAIGSRPIDLHLEAMRALGADLREDGSETIEAYGECMHGGTIALRFPSVGATENSILAAVMQAEDTVLEGAAREPEIDQLCEFLNMRGAQIRRLKNGSIQIAGGRRLGSVRYQIHSDRIVTGTYLLAAAASRGRIGISNFPTGELDSLQQLLTQMGGRFWKKNHMLFFEMSKRPEAVFKVCTAPYPGFPTDLQPQLTALFLGAQGESQVIETLFENRFRAADEMKKMGADITVNGSCAVIRGKQSLHAAKMEALDLRGGAALAVAALQAEGTSVVTGAEYIERGYEDIVRDLQQLGAAVSMKESEG